MNHTLHIPQGDILKDLLQLGESTLDKVSNLVNKIKVHLKHSLILLLFLFSSFLMISILYIVAYPLLKILLLIQNYKIKKSIKKVDKISGEKALELFFLVNSNFNLIKSSINRRELSLIIFRPIRNSLINSNNNLGDLKNALHSKAFPQLTGNTNTNNIRNFPESFKEDWSSPSMEVYN